MSATARIRVGVIALALASLVALLGIGVPSALGAPDSCDRDCQGEIDKARAATERYWLVDEAIRAGFVESSTCERSEGSGTLGIRYTHLARSLDQSVDPEQPESLIYMREGYNRTGRRLVAVEYSVPVLAEGQAPPELFGRQFEGPTSAGGGLPQFRLRVWLFSDNPAGLFEAANPAEACRGAELLVPHAFEQDVHEVLGAFTVEARKVREVLGLPEELRLRGEGEDGSGDAQLWVDGRLSRWSTGDGPAVSTHLAPPS